MLLALPALLATVVSFGFNAPTSSASSTVHRWKVESIAVPNQFDQLTAEDSSVFLEAPPTLSGSFQGGCVPTKIDSQPLRLGAKISGCEPGPPGERFSIKYVRVGSLKAYWNCKPESAADRVVSFDPSTRRVTVGPIIMRVSGTCSHDYPVWVYAAGSLWVYNASAGPAGRSGAIAEVSTSTGRLETLVYVPNMPAAVIAANEDGFYVGPGEFYQSGQGIYHVAPGSRHAQFLKSVPGPMAWLFGFGHSMYAGLQYDYAKPCTDHDCQLWRFQGLTATSKIVSDDVNPGDTQPDGNASVGILITRPESPASASFDVVRINASTGVTQLLASVPVSEQGFIESTAFASGSFYVLVDEIQGEGQTRLIQISP